MMSCHPQRYLTDTPGIGGQIKSCPDDFVVDELPSYHPTGEGEHLYLFIEKSGLEHRAMIQMLARHFGVQERAIGCAGMKDKVAVARQQVSIHLPGRSDSDLDGTMPDERIKVLSADWHRNKLRRGHLLGNRFTIRIRGVDALAATTAWKTLQIIEAQGIPAWFGEQRFGQHANNHLIGAAIVRNDWENALHHLLGTGVTNGPEDQREAREAFETGDLQAAAAFWRSLSGSESRVLRALNRGDAPGRAIKSMGSTQLRFFMHAFQSAVFNATVDRRVEDGTISTLHVGDVAWVHGHQKTFDVSDDDLAKEETAQRLQNVELSPSGPLWGPSMRRASGATDAMECAALEATGLTPEDLQESGVAPDGGRRPLRMPVKHIEFSGGVDADGGFVSVAFDLPPGGYATIVLRELMKSDTRAQAGELVQPSSTP